MELKQNLIQQDQTTIKLFLGSSPKLPASVLTKCFISLMGDEILICCQEKIDAHALWLRRKHLKKPAAEIGASRITLILMGSAWRHSLLVNNFPIAPTIMNQNPTTDTRVLTIPEWELKKELCEFQGVGGAKVVRFADNQSIDCNERVELSSGVRPNDWLKLDHRSLWVPEEFSTFKDNLVKNIELRNYPYVAYLANLQKCRFVVDARLAIYRGDLVRIVKVHSCNPI